MFLSTLILTDPIVVFVSRLNPMAGCQVKPVVWSCNTSEWCNI